MLNQAEHLRLVPRLLPIESTSTDESRDLDREFRRYYVDRMLPVARAGLGIGFVLAIAVCVLDAFLMPQAFYEKAIPLRIFTMLVPLFVAFGATFVIKLRTSVPYIIGATMLLVGLSTLIVGAIAAQTGAPMVAWGTIFLTFNVYLVMGLTLRQSASVGWPIYFIYVAVGIYLGAPLQKLGYGILFLGFSNVIGTYASYLLELDAREIFDKKRELRRLAQTDGLTGLFNRSAFDHHLRQVWKQARRDGCHIGVVVADIDHFKLYNDCYGHQEGDNCITTVAHVLAESVSRPLDMVARYGGEEFVMVLYDPSASFLESFTRTLCQKIVALDIEHKASGDLPNVALSIGAAMTETPVKITPEQLIRQADDALYEAKSQGRNRAIVYQPEWGQQTTAHLAAVLV